MDQAINEADALSTSIKVPALGGDDVSEGATLALRAVNKSYGEVQAVADLSLEVRKGELLALIGPSGCGKTSTCKMIAGLESITGGELILAGRRVNELAPEQRNIAMVFEDYALYPRLNVFDNVAFPLRVRRVPRDEIRSRVGTMLEKLELTPAARHRVQDLSGGQQQRVSIARALVRDPVLLIMDEPLSHLDINLKGRLRTEIRVLQQQLGLTGVLVTHDQAEAMALADRIAIMHLGELRQCATPDEVYNEPVDMFVAGFIGEPPMNFFPGKLVDREGRLRFVTDGLELELPDQIKGRLAEAGELDLSADEHDVVVGIRPEDITLAPSTEAADGRGTVFFTEWFGSFQAVMLAHPGKTDHWLTLLVGAGEECSLGETVNFGVRAETLKLFDPETERALLASASRGPREEAPRA